eukprot:m.74064 g.74064  ORF g.74064 m.74064 type:complete len:277 (-) comp16143_c0_seq2:63-893(-)
MTDPKVRNTDFSAVVGLLAHTHDSWSSCKQVWWAGLPIVTKTLFGASFGTTLAANFGVFNPMSLVLEFSMIYNKFQIWRLLSGVFFFGKLGFPFLIMMYWMYSYSLKLEREHFDRRTADYVYALMFVWIVLLVVAFFFNMMIVGIPFVLAIVYIWCSINADVIVNFWFGLTFQAMYFPWVLMAFSILTGGSGMGELIGIFAGHCYFFLKTKYPRDYGGPNLLETPMWLRNLFPDEERQAATSFGVAPASGRQQQGQPPRAPQGWGGWGQGRQLGGQ